VFVATFVVNAIDSDNDGMSDAYELMFGLAPATTDGDSDPDADNLSNVQESLLWTDPFASDTDQDGWTDDTDENPVSRATIPWGSLFFTHSDGSVRYTWPLWMQAAWADGGLWLTNSPCGWHSPAAETTPATLHMEFDRAGVESNLVLRIEYLDHAASALYLDLFDTNDVITATALYGNLLAGSGAETNRILEIPFAATGIRLRKGAGTATVLGTLLYVDADLDGLDAGQEVQLGTSDFLADSDGDGISDLDEVFSHGTNPANADTDCDGIGDGIELRMGLAPLEAGNYAALPFTETFEPAAVTVGELSGQNNWDVNLPGVAIVQTNEVFSGLQALRLANQSEANGIPVIRHLFANAPAVVWLDIRQKAFAAAVPVETPDGAVAFLLNDNGHLVVHDGLQPEGQRWVALTNAPAIPHGEWVRITIRADYAAQTWLACINGRLLADNLGFATPQERFTAIDIEGQSAVMDNIHVGTEQPSALATVPGNIIPDDWYRQHFGSLGTDTGDPDADGLTNLQEYHLGTAPVNPDTDGDDFSDGHEVSVGSVPLDPLSYPVTLTGTITYTGSLTGLLQIAARSDSGDRHLTLATTGQGTTYRFTNLISRNHYTITAFLDTTGSGIQHPWHPAGVYAASPLLNPLTDLQNIDITLTDVLTRQVWKGITNTAIPQLTNDPRFPFQPDQENIVTGLFEAPVNAAEYFGQRILGRFLTPRSGNYTFWIASDDNGQLWITDTNGTRQLIASVTGYTASRQWNKFVAQQSSPIPLQAGQVVPVEALAKEHGGNDNLAVGIQFPDGRIERPMRARWFETPPAGIAVNTDADGDGLSDYEEWVYGSDPLKPDMSGDGMTDYEKIILGLDPARMDTYGDGLPDWWVVQQGLDHTLSQAARDADGDGLTNAEEFQLGFDPNDGIADNDGDGLPDWEEIHRFGTSPFTVDTDADGTNDASVVWQTDGTNTTHRNGQWADVGSTLAALANRSMRAEYTVPVTNAGMHRLAFAISNVHTQPAAGARFRFQILIDNIPVGWATSPSFSLQPSSLSLSLTTPWLTTGEHVVRLAWLDDYAAGKLLGIESVSLQRVDGADNDLSGIADWEEWVLDQGYDTDGDGLSDQSEISFQVSSLIPHPSLNPLSADTDGDNLSDGFELTSDLCPLTSDSNSNGIPDAVLKATRKGVATSHREVVHITNVWKEDGDNLYNPMSGILISYDFPVTNAGMHLLAFDLRNRLADPPDDYRFQVQVSVNGRALATRYVQADLDRTGTGRFITPWLTPGTHTISLKWLNDKDAGGRATTIAVEEVRLYAFDAPDTNGDGIQDWQAAALQSAGDSDGDGISDFLEVTVRGTSPVLKDTDGDGIDDNVEITLGLDPTRVDTDGDGVSDWQERNETLTNPLVPEFDGTVSTVDQVNGADCVSSAGTWSTNAPSITALYRRGQVEYQMTCATGDIHFLEIRAAHLWAHSTCSPLTPVDTSDLLITIDGDYIGKRELVSLDGIPARIGVFTPWLAPGTHTVRLCWENTNRQLQLRIDQLAILQLGGFDADGNGIRDWVETYLASTTSLAPVPATSLVSPVCIEGTDRFVPLVSVAPAPGTTNAPAVYPSIAGRWYSNVALAPTGATPIAVSFQNGAITRHAQVTWTPRNLLEFGGELMIRQGDSLKLTAVPAGATNGTVTIGVGAASYTTDVNTPVIIEFPEAGNYTLTGAFTPADSSRSPARGTLPLRVIAATFPSNAPACMIGTTRNWSCPGIPPQAVLQTDSTVVMSGTTNLSIRMTKVNRDHYVIARLGPNGPIMAHQKLDGFWIQAAVDGYVRVVERQDTYQIWEQNMVTKLLPDTVDIEISIFIGGVTFADDMTTTRWISAADLDAIGEYTFQLLHPNSVSASVCHRIKAYQNGLYLGEAYYSQILMPDE